MTRLVTAVFGATALFFSLTFGANITRDYKILRDSTTNYFDLSIYGTPSQSSTYSHPCNPTAAKAGDGNNEGVFYPWCTVSHTNNDASAWWEIDLMAKSLVYSVVVFNRIDCCMDRLSNFDIILTDLSHHVLKSIYEKKGGREMMTFPMHPTLTGVYHVRIQLRGTNYLSLAEVYIYGNNKEADEKDVARYKPATQSSTYNHSCSPTASVAVDGNTEGVFYPWCSVTHTNNDAQAWWQVDLQGSHTIRHVRVFNRVDCCMERLANFNVTLRNSAGATLATKNFAGGTNTELYVFKKIVHDVRYVRVHLLGQNYLSLAEVQVIHGDRAS